MKRSPLRRRTQLRARVGLKRRTGLKPVPFNPSRKAQRRHLEEAKRRREVYTYLWNNCPVNEQGVRICKKCGRPLDWHWMGHEMHHVISLGQGGKTTIHNCELWCFPCHHRRHTGRTPK